MTDESGFAWVVYTHRVESARNERVVQKLILAKG